MNFGDIMLNEMSEARQIVYDFTDTWNQKTNKIHRQIHRCRDQLTVTRVEAGRGMGEMNKEANCVAINGNHTCGGDNVIAHIRQSVTVFTPETTCAIFLLISSMLPLSTYVAYFTNIYIPTFIYKDDCGIETNMQHSFW